MRSSNIHIPGCYIIGTVIAAGHREPVMGTVGVIKAVGQNDIPPQNVGKVGVIKIKGYSCKGECDKKGRAFSDFAFNLDITLVDLCDG